MHVIKSNYYAPSLTLVLNIYDGRVGNDMNNDKNFPCNNMYLGNINM